ncbi:MarR family transcriptional regulator [Nitriliruptoraceae bacterium ZYF776]|nr:MarR family transcriptional regulator [Profundirhabdus halotolerans]
MATDDGTDHVDRLIEQWGRERPELDTAPLRISARIMRLERYLDRQTQEQLATFGLNEGETNVLAALRRAGPPYALTPTDLYRSLLVSSGAMTNRLDRLEAAGLLERTPDPEDRRKVQVRLTEAGRERIDAALDDHTRRMQAELDFLEADDAEALAGLLRKVLRGFEARDPEA